MTRHVGRAQAPVGVESDRLDRRGRVVLVRERRRDAQDPCRIRGRRVGAEREREATVRPLDLIACQRLGQRPVGVAIRAGAGGDDDRRRRFEVAQRGHGVLAVAVGPQHERARDGVAAAVPAGPWRAAHVDVSTATEHDRPRRQSTQTGRTVKDLAHALTVVEAVAQLEQLAAAGRPGESAEEPDHGLVAVVVVGVIAVTVTVVAARGRCCAAGPRWWSGGPVGLARRAIGGGLLRGGLVAGLPARGLAAGEELDALSDDVDPRRVLAVLGLELVEQQPPVDGDLASAVRYCAQALA